MGKSSLFLLQNFLTSNRHTIYFEISFKRYPLGLNKSLDFFPFFLLISKQVAIANGGRKF